MISLYDVVMTTLTVGGSAGALYFSYRLAQAAKRGNVQYLGKTTIKETHTCPTCGEEYARGVECDLCKRHE